MKFDHTNLPSLCKPYPVDSFDFKPFGPKQISLMSKSLMLGSLVPQIEAVSSCLTGLDIRQLTIGDYFYLLTWQRVNCFKTNTPNLLWDCSNSVFYTENSVLSPSELTAMVDAYEQASDSEKEDLTNPDDIATEVGECTYGNLSKLTMDSFSITQLDDDLVLDPRLDYPRCKDLAEWAELREDPDYGTIADAALWVKGNKPLADRIRDIMDNDDMDLMEQACAANRDIAFGINRYVTLPCDRCGQTQTHSVVIDSRSFLL